MLAANSNHHQQRKGIPVLKFQQNCVAHTLFLKKAHNSYGFLEFPDSCFISVKIKPLCGGERGFFFHFF